jgi:hypothetical protein
MLPILTPAIIIGGISFGFFSPTEAAVVASLYAMFLSMVVYREMGLNDLWRVVLDTIRMTANVCMIVATASVFAWILAANQAPMRLAGWLLELSSDPLVLLIIINIAVFIAGFFLEGTGNHDPGGAGAGATTGRCWHRPGPFRRRLHLQPDDRPDDAANGRGSVCGLGCIGHQA